MSSNKLVFAILIALILFTNGTVFDFASAQEQALGVATKLEVVGDSITNGSVVCTFAEKLTLCDSAYATSIFGVVVDEPALALESSETVEAGYYVVRDGQVGVRVSNTEGEIAVGDLITSSTIPGVAAKAVKGGYVLGIAQEALTQNEGVIEVLLHIHPESRLVNARTNLYEVLQKGTQASVLEPLDSLRYLLAAILVIVSFTLGFVYFGRMTRASIEAIGRNPLAQKEIRLSVILHMIVTFVVVIIGLGAAYLVLIL